MENKLEYYAIRGFKEFAETAHANITLTNKCNNNCYYCIGGFNVPRKRYEFLTRHQFSELVKLLLAQKKPRISMTLIGGEPTVHEDFPYFLNEAYKLKNNYVHVTTNLLKPYEYFKSLPLKKSFDFTCSYHSNGVKDENEWFSKVDLLYEKGCLFNVFLMLTEKNIDKIKKVYEKYKGRYIIDNRETLIVYPINEFAYSEKFKELTKSIVFDYFNTHADCRGDRELNSDEVQVLLSDGTNDYLNYDTYKSFYFMLCHCALAVHPNGNVTRCLHDIAPVITLGRDKPRKLPDWHLCRQKKCICDLEYPKCSIDYYKKHFRKENINGS
jgi:sulfatase maturation enzyme AslB (radical SAM superfamily)